MSVDITGFGTILTLTASITFPTGLIITEFSDDADALDFPSLVIAEASKGVNGDLISYSRTNVIKITINVIPNSLTDKSLNILFNANLPSKNKSNARDVIGGVVVYPDLNITNLSNGRALEFIPGKGIANSGRQKTRSYSFAFEGI